MTSFRRAAHAVIVSALVAAGAPVAAAAQDKPPVGDTAADWLKRPSPNDLMSVWPSKALKTGAGGKATIDCRITVRGLLSNCQVLEESPPGQGFGAAAVMLSAQFLMKPATHNGQPVEAGVKIPINFPPFQPPSGPMVTQTVLPVRLLVSAPTYAQVAAAYPEKARLKGVGAHVALRCDVRKAGALSCSTISEEPRGLGAAAAAKSLSSLFLAPTTFKDGKSTRDALMQVSVTFTPEMLRPDAAPSVGRADWVAAPSLQELSQALPKTSAAVGTIRVALDCLVLPGGYMSDCKVAAESPAGQGFGAGALTLAPHIQIAVWTAEGLPTAGGRVRVPIRYELAAAPAEPPAKP